MRNIALLSARLAVGGGMAAHGAQKALGWFEGPGPAGTAKMMHGLGFRPGETYAASGLLERDRRRDADRFGPRRPDRSRDADLGHDRRASQQSIGRRASSPKKGGIELAGNIQRGGIGAGRRRLRRGLARRAVRAAQTAARTGLSRADARRWRGRSRAGAQRPRHHARRTYHPDVPRQEQPAGYRSRSRLRVRSAKAKGRRRSRSSSR